MFVFCNMHVILVQLYTFLNGTCMVKANLEGVLLIVGHSQRSLEIAALNDLPGSKFKPLSCSFPEFIVP